MIPGDFQRLLPVLWCGDIEAASGWLVTNLGFEQIELTSNASGIVYSAVVSLGNNEIRLVRRHHSEQAPSDVKVPMLGCNLGSARSQEKFPSQAFIVYVKDVMKLFLAIKSRGAGALSGIVNGAAGGQAFSVRAPEGHVWFVRDVVFDGLLIRDCQS